MTRTVRLSRLDDAAVFAQRRVDELVAKLEAAFQYKWRCEQAFENLLSDLEGRIDERRLRQMPGGDLAR